MNKPPIIIVIKPIDGDKIHNDLETKGTIFDESETIAGFYRINEGPWKLIPNPEAWSFSIPKDNFIIGNNILTIKATDGELDSIQYISFNYSQENPNNKPPSITISSPQNGSTMKGLFEVKGISYDDVLVEEVAIRIDLGNWHKANGTDNWNFIIDLTGSMNRWIIIEAKAFDGEFDSNIVKLNLFINNSYSPLNINPILVIELPVEGASILNILICKGSVQDDNTSISTFYSIDNDNWYLLTHLKQWEQSIPMVSLGEGPHQFAFFSYDGELASKKVIINITFILYQKPIVLFTNLVPSQHITNLMIISGNVLYGKDVAKVELRFEGGSWLYANGTRNWTCNLEINDEPFGDVLIEARAKDIYGYSDIFNITIIHDYLLPKVRIISPVSETHFTDEIEIIGETQKGSLEIKAVQIRVNEGQWIIIEESSNWRYLLKDNNLNNSLVHIEVRAWDGISFSEIDDIFIIHDKEKYSINPFNIYYYIIITLIIVSLILYYIKKKRNHSIF